MTSKKIMFFLLLFTYFCDANSGFSIVGSGNIEKVSRELKQFNVVNIEGGFVVEFHQSSQESSIELIGDDNIVSLISTDVNDQILFIRTKRSFSTTNQIHLLIKSPKLSEMNISGAVSTNFHGLKESSLKLFTNGSGDIVADGEVSTLILEANGAGNINLKELLSENVTININGTGNVVTSVKKNLNVNIVGVGEIIYFGNPLVNKTVAGVADIHQSE